MRLSEGINYVRSRKRKLVSRLIKRIPMPGFRSCGPRYKKITIPQPFHRMYYPADTPASYERFVSFTGKRIRDTSLGRTYVNIHRTSILYEYIIQHWGDILYFQLKLRKHSTFSNIFNYIQGIASNIPFDEKYVLGHLFIYDTRNLQVEAESITATFYFQFFKFTLANVAFLF